MNQRGVIHTNRLLFVLAAIVASLVIPPFLDTGAFNLTPQGKGGEIISKPTLSSATKSEPPRRLPAAPSNARVAQKSLPSKFTNKYRMEFVLIPSGKFMMGSVEGSESVEKPVHGVTIAEPFYMARYEVTQWQWQAAMATTVDQLRRRVEQASTPRRGAGVGSNYPMYYVSWQEAHAFLQRLNALGDGYVYRLPSEAEWEYACRAGGSGELPGDLTWLAWYKTNSNDSVHDVGMRRSNAFGLYDMLGNVWEWCEDTFHENYDGAPADGSVWLGTSGSSSERVSRGGSFFTGNLAFMKCAARGAEADDYRDFETGFRVVAAPRR